MKKGVRTKGLEGRGIGGRGMMWGALGLGEDALGAQLQRKAAGRGGGQLGEVLCQIKRGTRCGRWRGLADWPCNKCEIIIRQ